MSSAHVHTRTYRNTFVYIYTPEGTEGRRVAAVVVAVFVAVAVPVVVLLLLLVAKHVLGRSWSMSKSCWAVLSYVMQMPQARGLRLLHKFNLCYFLVSKGHVMTCDGMCFAMSLIWWHSGELLRVGEPLAITFLLPKGCGNQEPFIGKHVCLSMYSKRPAINP